MTARIDVGPAVDLVATDRTVWVAELGSVVRVDGATGRVVARIRTPAVGEDGHIAVGAGGVWVTAGLELGGGGTVYRIDPSTDRVVATVRVGGVALGIAVGDGRVWVARVLQGRGGVVAIDPRTSAIDGHAVQVGSGPGQVTYGDGAVWVQNTSPASVVRVDPANGHVTTVDGTDATDHGPFVVGAIAVGDGSLWTVRNDALARWDPGIRRVVATITIPRAEFVAVARREVWVLAAARSSSPSLFYAIKHTAALWEVDPTDDRIIGRPLLLNRPSALTVDRTSVWVLEDGRGGRMTSLLRVTAASASRP